MTRDPGLVGPGPHSLYNYDELCTLQTTHDYGIGISIGIGVSIGIGIGVSIGVVIGAARACGG